MLSVKINGKKHSVAGGTTILAVLHSLGVKLPALCDDPRLKPIGACRLCLVEIAGVARPVTACNTPLVDGMEIQTNSLRLDQLRATNFHLLTSREERPPGTALLNSQAGNSALVDDSHPYIRVDMSRCIDCFRCVRICDEVQGQSVWRVWNRGDATCIRPDSGTTLLASSCVSCGACVDTCPSRALEDKAVLEMGMATHWTRTICAYCGVGCEMIVGTRENQIVQIRPAQDAPVNKGHLCVKGRYAWGFNHASDRVTQPMIRGKDGQWKTASWEEALSVAAENLHTVIAEYGPDSVGVLGSARGTNEENYLAQKFARVVIGTNNIDCCARVCHAPTAAAMKAMLGTGAATNSFDDIENTRGFLLCGTNPTENHPVVGARIKQQVRRGARLIVIDPRQIELARYADIHLQIRPGTNVPLLNAMASVIVQDRLFDEPVVSHRLSEWDEFCSFVSGYAPEKVAELCGVEAQLIREAARLYAETKPAMSFHGLGITEHTQGTEAVMCLVNLALLTGNLGKSGSGVNPLRGQNNVQGSAHMGCDPDHLPGFVTIQEGRDLVESAWRTRLPRSTGLNLMQMMDAARDGSLKALWAIGYDIGATNPNSNAMRKSLQSLDFFIVQDLFLNGMARECGSVFLPAASSFERDGTFMNSERRVQRIRKALEPPGEAKADWEIICDFARAMDRGELFRFRSAEEIWEEIRQVWKAGHGITYSRLEKGGLQWPCPAEDHAGTTILHREAFAGGQRAALRRIDYLASAEGASTDYPFLLITGRSLYQFNSGSMTMRTPNRVFRAGDTLDISPQDAERLSLCDGEVVRVRSRYGETSLPVSVRATLKPGELFTTFHAPDLFVNRLLGPARDNVADTPEYKITAVRLVKLLPETQPH